MEKKCTVSKRYTASLGLPPDADEASPCMVLRSHLGKGNAELLLSQHFLVMNMNLWIMKSRTTLVKLT